MKTNMKFGALALSMLAVACSGGEKAPEPQSNDGLSNAQAASANASAAAVENGAGNVSAPAPSATPEPTKGEDKQAAADKAVTKPATVIPASVPAAPAPEPVAAVITPPATYARCAVCHDAQKGGEDKLGPNLYGVFGTKAGKHRPGFTYSAALKSSGIVWNEASLDKWLTKPMEMVPGTTMSFPGIKDPAKRQELIDYLKSLK